MAMERPKHRKPGRGEADEARMSKSSSSKTSQTDWPRLKAMRDTDVTLSDVHPATEVQHIVRGIARQGLRPVPPKR